MIWNENEGRAQEGNGDVRVCIAFSGSRRVARGGLPAVAAKAKAFLDRHTDATVLLFDDVTGEVVEVDFRGTAREVLERLERAAERKSRAPDPARRDVGEPRGPGRPRLGVISREVTLLPRHWDWLNDQPGGASVAMRRLVEEARRGTAGKDQLRQAREAAYRFTTAVAGNERGYEEAIRALFAGKRRRFEQSTADWPADIRGQARRMAGRAFESVTRQAA